MKALWFLLPFLLACAVPPAGASAGSTFRPSGCTLKNERQGQPGALSMIEMGFDCDGLEFKMEITRPLSAEAYKRHMATQTIRFQESYSAGRNPYTGFVSGTTRCPAEKNYRTAALKTALQEVRLHIGRLSERGAWGGCGGAEVDRWGAATSFFLDSALVDITIKSREKMDRPRFQKTVESVLKRLEKM